jgi:hypothetical protein
VKKARLEKKGRRKKMTWGPICQQVERREITGVFWTIQKYGGLQVDPRISNTYKMAHLRQRTNCNGISPNR